MIPVIAVLSARNGRENYIHRGGNKFLDNCFIWTVVGFVCLFGILAIL